MPAASSPATSEMKSWSYHMSPGLPAKGTEPHATSVMLRKFKKGDSLCFVAAIGTPMGPAVVQVCVDERLAEAALKLAKANQKKWRHYLSMLASRYGIRVHHGPQVGVGIGADVEHGGMGIAVGADGRYMARFSEDGCTTTIAGQVDRATPNVMLGGMSDLSNSPMSQNLALGHFQAGADLAFGGDKTGREVAMADMAARNIALSNFSGRPQGAAILGALGGREASMSDLAANDIALRSYSGHAPGAAILGGDVALGAHAEVSLGEHDDYVGSMTPDVAARMVALRAFQPHADARVKTLPRVYGEEGGLAVGFGFGEGLGQGVATIQKALAARAAGAGGGSLRAVPAGHVQSPIGLIHGILPDAYAFISALHAKCGDPRATQTLRVLAGHPHTQQLAFHAWRNLEAPLQVQAAMMGRWHGHPATIRAVHAAIGHSKKHHGHCPHAHHWHALATKAIQARAAKGGTILARQAPVDLTRPALQAAKTAMSLFRGPTIGAFCGAAYDALASRIPMDVTTAHRLATSPARALMVAPSTDAASAIASRRLAEKVDALADRLPHGHAMLVSAAIHKISEALRLLQVARRSPEHKARLQAMLRREGRAAQQMRNAFRLAEALGRTGSVSLPAISA